MARARTAPKDAAPEPEAVPAVETPATDGVARLAVPHVEWLKYPGVSETEAGELGKTLDRERVRQHPYRRVDYLPEHDVVRTANRIFGFGRWGYKITELACLGQAPVTKDGKQGLHVGYRCTVELTITGCVPVCGVGYGDATEYTQTAAVTAHELAVKEAESDAKKRAFKNFGDQFGLILYAKTEQERAQIESRAHQPQGNANDGVGDSDRPAAVTDATEGSLRELPEGDRAATETEISALLDLGAKLDPQGRSLVEQALGKHRAKNRGGFVSHAWLSQQVTGLTRKLAEKEGGSQFQPPAGATSGPTAADVEHAFDHAA